MAENGKLTGHVATFMNVTDRPLISVPGSLSHKSQWSREVARWFRSGLACDRPFRLPVPEYPAMRRFHLPLFEPDRRVYRIRLSDQAVHAFAHGTTRRSFDSTTNPKVWCR